MKIRFASFIIPVVSFIMMAVHYPANKKVLIFSKTAGYHHASIATGIKAILELGNKNNFSVDTTTNAELFTTPNLKQYAVVIFLSTTGDVLNAAQQTSFENYIKGGGGFVGVHAATDTEYDWPWYGNLVGAWFKSHPAQQTATLEVVDQKSMATKHLPQKWERKDEWYNFKWMTTEKIHVLIKIDENSYKPGDGAMGDNHPMSWYHDFDGGHSFYTELGHTDESWSDPLYLQHLLGGIRYAAGDRME